jgi:nucleotide-binding universal stress UspA family protein
MDGWHRFGSGPLCGEDRRPRVVVGVDGSPGSRAALIHALTTATQRGAVLEVVSCYPVNLVWTGGLPLEVTDTEAIRADTESRARASAGQQGDCGGQGVGTGNGRVLISQRRARGCPAAWPVPPCADRPRGFLSRSRV